MAVETLSVSSYGNYLRVDKDVVKGRQVIATGDTDSIVFRQGSCVLREQAFAHSILSAHRHSVCAVCLSRADCDIRCDDCNEVAFCSDACFHAYAPFHTYECETLEDVDLIATSCKTDRDLLRAIIKILCVRKVGSLIGREVYSVPSHESIQATYSGVLGMVHVVRDLELSWINSLRLSAEKLLESLPVQVHVSGDEIVELGGRINENAHAITAMVDGENYSVVGIGLFPAVALINHSCFPNCTWSNVGGIVTVKAIRPICADEEITISYVSMLSTRRNRREELLKTKHFECKCTRCTEPLSESVDGLLEGFGCSKCKQRLLLSEPGAHLYCPLCSSTLHNPRAIEDSARSDLQQAKKSLAKRDFSSGRTLLEAWRLKYDISCEQCSEFGLITGNLIVLEALKALIECLEHLSHFEEACGLYDVLQESYRKILPPCTPLIISLSMNEIKCKVSALTIRGKKLERGGAQHEALVVQLEDCRRAVETCFAENHPLRQEIDSYSIEHSLA